jgi:ribosomal protein L40E
MPEPPWLIGMIAGASLVIFLVALTRPKTKPCPDCLKPVDARASVCPYCRHDFRLDLAPTETTTEGNAQKRWACLRCRTDNPPMTDVCRHCGARRGST